MGNAGQCHYITTDVGGSELSYKERKTKLGMKKKSRLFLLCSYTSLNIRYWIKNPVRLSDSTNLLDYNYDAAYEDDEDED